MKVQQLQVAFDPRADRLLLRIASAEREEVRVALTRRLVKALWPHLRQVLDGHLGGAAVPPPVEDASQEPVGSFTEPFDETDLTHPLGTEPLLAAESRLQPLDGPRCRLTLGELRARRVAFDCDRDLMQALCAMIRATVAKADWDLDLDALKPPPEHAGEPPTLH